MAREIKPDDSALHYRYDNPILPPSATRFYNPRDQYQSIERAELVWRNHQRDPSLRNRSQSNDVRFDPNRNTVDIDHGKGIGDTFSND